jgi:hypothetical protein
MTIRELEEGHPIYVAIDRGGGQTCDINGVVRALDAAGYVIVPKEPTAKMIEEGSCVDGKHSALEIWRYMVEAAVGETVQPPRLDAAPGQAPQPEK